MQQSDINNLVSMEKDILSHPSDDLEYLNPIFNSDVFSKADIENINQAFKIILGDESLTDINKGNLLQNSWKINHKFKYPSPEEFLSEKWIGPQAKDLYAHCRKAFIDFFDPRINKNKLIMYCCTG